MKELIKPVLINLTRISIILAVILSNSINTYSQSLVINEVVASNLSLNQDLDGDYEDWIEIYNSGDVAINLKGFGLSDDESDLLKWQFPSVSLQPHSFLLVWASGKDRRPAETESSQGLVRQIFSGIAGGNVIDLLNNSAYPYQPDFEEILNGSFESPVDFAENYGQRIHGYILPPMTGEFSFWISGDDNCQLFLSPSENPLEAVKIAENPSWTFPREWTKFESQKSAKIPLEKGKYYYISALMKEFVGTDHISVRWQLPNNTIEEPIPFNRLFNFNAELHTNFSIKGSGEALYLSDSAANILDWVDSTLIANDISYGRLPDGQDNWKLLLRPTPGSENLSSVYLGQCEKPVFSINSGFSSSFVQTTITSATQGAKIYYSLDGSVPTEESTLYSGPLSIIRTMAVRARAFSDILQPSETTTKNYFINENFTVPVVSITTDPYNLYDPDYGMFIYWNPYWESNLFQDWERPAHIQLIETDKNSGFDMDVGIKVHGGLTRGSIVKSLAVMARSIYGENKINYKLFEDKDLSTFNNLVLRNGGNDFNFAILRDAFMQGIISGEMDLDLASSRPSVVYLNGKYWGVHDIREKLNEHFIAGNYNFSPENVDLLEFVHNSIEVQELEGSADDYKSLIEFIQNNQLSDKANYDQVKSQIDINNYIEYQLAQIYFDNSDWPGNNIKWWRQNTPAGKWRWILFDTDFGFNLCPFGTEQGDELLHYKHNTLANATREDGGTWPDPPHSTFLFINLLKNESFRNQFINTFCDHLNSTFKADRVTGILENYKNLYEPEIIRHREYFPSSVNWYNEIATMKTFAELRSQYVYTHLLYKFGLSRNKTITLDVDNPEKGNVGINTLICSEYPWSGIYFPNIPVTLKALPKPGYQFVKWSDGSLSDEREIDVNSFSNLMALFEPSIFDPAAIVISEINYNSSLSIDSEDWIEFYNNSEIVANVSGWNFKDDNDSHNFIIPVNTLIGPKDLLVICRDKQKFEALYPEIVNVIGDMDFGFSSNGEVLRLFDYENTLIDNVPYGVSYPWPDSSETHGRTLVLIDPDADNSLASNWRISNEIGGNPGVVNFIPASSEDIYPESLVFGLKQNYPNPFSGSTTIDYQVDEATDLTIQIFNLSGQLVKTLVNDYHTPGYYSCSWDGRNALGGEVEAEIFIYKMITSKTSQSMRMVRIK